MAPHQLVLRLMWSGIISQFPRWVSYLYFQAINLGQILSLAIPKQEWEEMISHQRDTKRRLSHLLSFKNTAPIATTRIQMLLPTNFKSSPPVFSTRERTDPSNPGMLAAIFFPSSARALPIFFSPFPAPFSILTKTPIALAIPTASTAGRPYFKPA